MVPSKLSIVIKAFLTLLTSIILNIVVNDFYMLTQIGKVLVTKAAILFHSIFCRVYTYLMTVKSRFLVEGFITVGNLNRTSKHWIFA